jgi:hypothetical protein
VQKSRVILPVWCCRSYVGAEIDVPVPVCGGRAGGGSLRLSVFWFGRRGTNSSLWGVKCRAFFE